MSKTPLYKFTASNYKPIGELRKFGEEPLIALREGPNKSYLKELRLAPFKNFSWENIQKILKRRVTAYQKIQYDNLFWEYSLTPTRRVLYKDSAENVFFKLENEWKLAVKSSDLGSIARINSNDFPTIFEHSGHVYCYYADLDAPIRL